MLIVEVADVKAPIYAAHDVPEYWVIDAATLTPLLCVSLTALELSSGDPARRL